MRVLKNRSAWQAKVPVWLTVGSTMLPIETRVVFRLRVPRWPPPVGVHCARSACGRKSSCEPAKLRKKTYDDQQ